MKTRAFCGLLFLLFSSGEYPLLAQRSDAIDSLLRILRTLPNDTNKVKQFAMLGWLYGETNSNTELVEKYADSIRLLSEELNYQRGVALSHFYYGFNARHAGNYDEAQKHLNIFIDYFAARGDSTKVANGLYQLSVINAFLGDYERTLAINLRMLNISKAKKEPYGVSTALHAIGSTYFQADNYTKAIEYFNQSLKILDSLEGDSPTQAIAVEYSNLGYCYMNLSKNDTAKRYFRGALRISEEIGNDWGIAGALESLGYMAFRSGDYQQALTLHLKALTIRKRLGQKRELASSLANVGGTYLKLEDFDRANRYLLEGLALARETGNGFLVYEIYDDLSAVMSAKKDYKEAYDYHQLYAKAKDSVLTTETTERLRDLQARYETVEKDKKIAVLANEKEIRAKEMQRKSILTRSYGAGLAFVIVVAGLVFYILRQRLHLTARKNEIREADFRRQLTELEMRALRAQINPEFLYKCMKAINVMIQKGQTENASLYLAKFSKLVRLILENADAPTVTLASEMALLESYIQLEELRLPGRIGYTISVDSCIDVQSTYLPSMVLQPVVENAIWDGIVHKEKESKGNITIDVRQHEDLLLCTIEDNGVGRDKALQLRERSREKTGPMGMEITEERLRLRNRKGISEFIRITDLKDTTSPAVGTRVTIQIPIEEQNA